MSLRFASLLQFPPLVMTCSSAPAAAFLSAFIVLLSLSSSLKGELILSEFLASNIKNLADEDGAFEDWIEIRNTGTERASLAGWFLSDNSKDLRKWQFPATNLNAGASLVVFASNKDRHEIGKPLHTNFKLSQSGEFLALTKPDGLTSTTQFSPAYPVQIPDISYGFGLISTNLSLITSTSNRRWLIPSVANGGNRIGEAWKGGSEPFDDASWTSASGGVGYSGDDATLVGASDLAVRLNFDVAPAGSIIADTKPLGTPRNANNSKAFWVASMTDRSANSSARSGVTQFAATNLSLVTIPANADFNGAVGTLSFWMLSGGNVAPGTDAAVVFDRRTSSGGLSIQQRDDGRIGVVARGASSSIRNSFSSGGSVGDNQWTMWQSFSTNRLRAFSRFILMGNPRVRTPIREPGLGAPTPH